MTNEEIKIVNFLEANLVKQKASPNPKSNMTLDYNTIVFPNDILPKTASFKKLPFSTDWNWIMIVRKALLNKGIKINIEDTFVSVQYKQQEILLWKICKEGIEGVFQASLIGIDFYNDNLHLFK